MIQFSHDSPLCSLQKVSSFSFSLFITLFNFRHFTDAQLQVLKQSKFSFLLCQWGEMDHHRPISPHTWSISPQLMVLYYAMSWDKTFQCPKFIGYPEAVDNTHAQARARAHTRTHTRTHTNALTISAYFVVCSIMPRVYIRKTDKGQVPREVMERAILAVKERMPARKAAKTYSIARRPYYM